MRAGPLIIGCNGRVPAAGVFRILCAEPGPAETAPRAECVERQTRCLSQCRRRRSRAYGTPVASYGATPLAQCSPRARSDRTPPADRPLVSRDHAPRSYSNQTIE
ncbi:hypothetical protein JYU34_007601 [Plutella xylostella]|uniref:Uncharacterized protein n=1 Tax=Plutella xylostella TaxID=51655 RepID=A0ABQ7QQS6_PLUXY|nr:hypothetical protein JYU34_007601 [Plutella xylostella]